MRGTGAPHRNSIGAPLEKGFVDDGWVAARPTAFRCTEAADVDRIRYGIEDLTSSPELTASGPPVAKKGGLLDHRSLDASATSSNIVLTIPASRGTSTSCFVFGSVEYPNGILPATR